MVRPELLKPRTGAILLNTITKAKKTKEQDVYNLIQFHKPFLIVIIIIII